MAILKLYVDGAARGNPGQAGAGMALYDDTDQLIASSGSYLGPSLTNNRAEYMALILGLEFAKECSSKNQDAKNQESDLQVFSDSELMVQQMKGVYKVKHPDLKPLHDEARQRVKNFRRVQFQHVPREKNRMADQLANEAIDNRHQEAGLK